MSDDSWDVCRDGIDPLAVALRELADLAEWAWDPKQKLPVDHDTGTTIRVEATLPHMLEQRGINRILEWVEFNMESGPARRERLIEMLNEPVDPAEWIESEPHGAGRSRDPYGRFRVSADEDAEAVVCELRRAADYLKGLSKVIRPRPNPMEAPVTVQLHPPEIQLENTVYAVSPDAAILFDHLLTAPDQPGNWVSAANLGFRADRVTKSLPAPLRDLIESSPDAIGCGRSDGTPSDYVRGSVI